MGEKYHSWSLCSLAMTLLPVSSIPIYVIYLSLYQVIDPIFYLLVLCFFRYFLKDDKEATKFSSKIE